MCLSDLGTHYGTVILIFGAVNIWYPDCACRVVSARFAPRALLLLTYGFPFRRRGSRLGVACRYIWSLSTQHRRVLEGV